MIQKSDMIIDLDPIVTRFVLPPKESNQINCNFFVAGILESVLNAMDFSAKVSAHLQSTAEYPHKTVFLIKFDESITIREKDI